MVVKIKMLKNIPKQIKAAIMIQSLFRKVKARKKPKEIKTIEVQFRTVGTGTTTLELPVNREIGNLKKDIEDDDTSVSMLVVGTESGAVLVLALSVRRGPARRCSGSPASAGRYRALYGAEASHGGCGLYAERWQAHCVLPSGRFSMWSSTWLTAKAVAECSAL